MLSDGSSKFLHGAGVDEPLQVDNGPLSASYLQDHLGSTSQLVNTLNGQAKARYDYASYGKLEDDAANPEPKNPFTYTGREDDNTGLMYYRARYYDSELELFISEDPLGDRQRYVGGNPLSFTDPLGLYKVDPDGTLQPENWREAQDLWENGGLTSETDETSWIVPGGIGRMTACKVGEGLIVRASAKAVATQMVKSTVRASLAKPYVLGVHTLERMTERGITTKMVEVALQKGQMYWDPKNKTVNYVLKNAFASGKDLRVGQNAYTGKITTVIRGNNLIKKTDIPLR